MGEAEPQREGLRGPPFQLWLRDFSSNSAQCLKGKAVNWPWGAQWEPLIKPEAKPPPPQISLQKLPSGAS